MFSDFIRLVVMKVQILSLVNTNLRLQRNSDILLVSVQLIFPGIRSAQETPKLSLYFIVFVASFRRSPASSGYKFWVNPFAFMMLSESLKLFY